MIRTTLTLCLLTLVAAPGCKKDATTPPEGDGGGAEVAGREDNDGAEEGGAGGYDGPLEEILSADAFEELMQAKQGDVADCFAAAKEANPELAGQLAFDITVAGDGSVASITFDEASSIQDATITACVEEKARGWQFYKTRDGGEMTLPYSLNLS